MDDMDLLEEAALGDELTGRKWKVRLIEGDKLGSTAYYPAETLLRDGPRIFRKGTPMYLNHQTAEERINRPFGSVQEFAGELAEDAYYDGDGLYANIEVFEHHAPMIKGLRDKIGISIRATARTVTETINGKSVPVAKELIKARSADFVVKAGAGGKLVTILESAIDTEENSSVKEEGLVMDEATKELLEGLKAAFTSQSKALTDLTESLKPVEKEQKVEETAAINPLEVAKELAAAELSEAATERVLERFEANKGTKTLAELIESEKAYLSANKTAEIHGVEESEKKTDVTEVTESAVRMPSRWATKKKESN